MNVSIENGITILTPSQGYAHLTNGSVWSDKVYLGKNASQDDWHDTNEEQPTLEELEQLNEQQQQNT